MQLWVNGEQKTVSASNVAALVSALALDIRKLAIERNGEIVPRSQYADTLLAEGDRLELVEFIGGG